MSFKLECPLTFTITWEFSLKFNGSQIVVFSSLKDDQIWGDWVILPKLKRILVAADSCCFCLPIVACLPFGNYSPVCLPARIWIPVELSIIISNIYIWPNIIAPSSSPSYWFKGTGTLWLVGVNSKRDESSSWAVVMGRGEREYCLSDHKCWKVINTTANGHINYMWIL